MRCPGGIQNNNKTRFEVCVRGRKELTFKQDMFNELSIDTT